MRWVRTGIALFPLGVLLAGSCAPASVPSAKPVATASASAPAQASPPIASAAEPTPVVSAAEPAAAASAVASSDEPAPPDEPPLDEPPPSDEPPPPPPLAAARLPRGYRIDPAALVGCRAPDEPGCGMCCDNSGGRCQRLSGLENWAAYPDVEPWYNWRSVNCPQDCPPCARCTRRSERELADMMPFRCDCAKTKIGVDPCFDPGSCGCECQHRARLTAACPKVP
jgi:hypothetical protein